MNKEKILNIVEKLLLFGLYFFAILFSIIGWWVLYKLTETNWIPTFIILFGWFFVIVMSNSNDKPNNEKES